MTEKHSVEQITVETETPEQKECKKAAEKAMNLLLQQDRTRKELQERLYRAGFSEHASEYAMNYVSGFGYIDDLRYATNYISYHKENRSKKELRYKLLNKGVEADTLALAFESYEPEDEWKAICHLVEKRLKGKAIEQLEYDQKNKLIAYLARKGFAIGSIQRFIRERERNS